MMHAFCVWLVLAGQQPSAQMAEDVARMVRASHRETQLMPWSKPLPEVDAVARHGKTVAPLLVVLLPADPDDPVLAYEKFDERLMLAGKQFDWRVQQSAAEALCKIYRPRVPRLRYSNRATREHNRQIRPFWLKVIAESP